MPDFEVDSIVSSNVSTAELTMRRLKRDWHLKLRLHSGLGCLGADAQIRDRSGPATTR